MSFISQALCSAIGLGVGAALLLAAPADAKSRKHRSGVSAAAAGASSGGQWGGNLVQTGPLYNGQDYLGTDPDPNIRYQILRDLSGRYGGGGD